MEDVESQTPGFLVQLAALRKASLLIQFDQRVIFSYNSKSQESLNTKLLKLLSGQHSGSGS